MNELFQHLPDDVRGQLKETEQPEWVDPMLATLTGRRFSDPGWIFERKLDGERCITYRNGDDVRLMSRNQHRLNVQYPELVEALAGQSVKHFIVDGEVVAFEGDLTSFSRLQDRMNIEDVQEARRSSVAVYYYIFDLLYFDGYDVMAVPLRHRKWLLKQGLSYADPMRYTTHRNEEGEAFFREACEKGWEGIIAKQAGAPYVHARSKTWLKFKCVAQQEFVIGGYADPHGERIGFGALLLGYYDGEKLKYAGKVGTGFDNETLQRLSEKLAKLEQDSPPFVNGDLPHKEVHWVRPELVAEIGFEEWTEYDRLRQPRFLGLRQDKDAKDVVKEEPQG